MNTFLPFPNPFRSVSVLDNARLGKQRVEVLQILKTLHGESEGWRNHPAVKMWEGHAEWLAAYGCAACMEWKARGFRDVKSHAGIVRLAAPSLAKPPPWMGDFDFHHSHRCNLLRKDAAWYGGISGFQDAFPFVPYVWPFNGVIESNFPESYASVQKSRIGLFCGSASPCHLFICALEPNHFGPHAGHGYSGRPAVMWYSLRQ